MAGLKATGEMDSETARYMSMSRCGVEDTLGSESMNIKGMAFR